MKASSIFGVAATTALATYFLDPQRGRGRRARVREKASAYVRELDDTSRAVTQDLSHRTRGVFSGLRTHLHSAGDPDHVLTERVKSKLGRVLSHPGAVAVTASAGSVTLHGPVLEHEAHRALKAAGRVPGVRDVVDGFERFEQSGNVSALQGGRPRRQRIDIMQERWAPATRLLVGSGGGLLAFRGLAHRSALALLLGAAGALLAVRAATNRDSRRLLGRRADTGLDFSKTIRIAAPVERVFECWSNFENFPRFMRNVRAVHRNADGDSWHWEVAGPLGATVQWDAKVTRSVPNELIAWATTPGSPIAHAGMVRFEKDGDGTRVQIQLTYDPPAGAAGHAVAALFGADPASEMDEDLMRLKAWLETGARAHDAALAPV
jgi:uncharacterized membrane protein